MASAGKAPWLIAASVGAMEALKDQGGMCRWNTALRSLHHYAKANMGAFSQTMRRHASVTDRDDERALKQSEESLRKVMYLSCWGPN